MKIVVITGSPHRHGTSAALAERFIRGAEEAGHSVYRFDAAFHSVHPCLGCDHCRKTAEGCVFQDGMAELNPHLLEADGIVFVSPIYYYDVNAQLKAVIDRFYANNAQLMGGRKTALLVTMADDTLKSAEGAVTSFRNMSDYLQWEPVGTVVAANAGDLTALEETDALDRAYRLGLRFH